MAVARVVEARGGRIVIHKALAVPGVVAVHTRVIAGVLGVPQAGEQAVAVLEDMRVLAVTVPVVLLAVTVPVAAAVLAAVLLLMDTQAAAVTTSFRVLVVVVVEWAC